MVRTRFVLLAVALSCFTPLAARAAETAAADPELVIQNGSEKAVYKRSELLARPDLSTVELKEDVSYPGKPVAYKAVPAAALFDKLHIASDAVIQFKCLDGFSAPISTARLLNKDPAKSVAYIAIEPADKPWPSVKPGGPSAGPFYLVWPKPELSFIGPEEWPFQLAAFEVKGSLKSLYPKIFPAADANAQVQKGFTVFTKNCFACHTLNKSGSSELGPDLNVPMNPTEYFTGKALKTLVRDPQALRHFPKSHMSPFPKEILADVDLDNLVKYLAYMAKHKQP